MNAGLHYESAYKAGEDSHHNCCAKFCHVAIRLLSFVGESRVQMDSFTLF